MVFGQVEIATMIARIIAYCQLNKLGSIDKWKFEETDALDYVPKVLARLETLGVGPKTLSDLIVMDWQLLTGEAREQCLDKSKKIITDFVIDCINEGEDLNTIISQFIDHRNSFPPELIAHYTGLLSGLYLSHVYDEVMYQSDLEKFIEFTEFINRTAILFSPLTSAAENNLLTWAVKDKLKDLESKITTAEEAYQLSLKKIFVSHWDELVEAELSKAETPDQIWNLFVWADPWSLAELNCLLKLDKVLQQ